MQRGNINNLERSTAPYSIPRTNDVGIQEYVPPGANGQVWTVVAGVAQYATITFPSPFEQYANESTFPVVGTVNVIYYALLENTFNIWNGSAYVAVPTAVSFTFTLTGNSGPSQVINNAATLTLLASRGFTVVASNPNTVTVTPPAGTINGQVMYWNNGTSTWSAVALTAADIANVPAGNIAAATVQLALNELDTEKQVNIQFQDETVNLGTLGTVNTINFAGNNIIASRAGNTVTITSTVLISATAGNLISLDGTGILAKQVIEYFTPSDGDTTLTLANTPKAGTPVSFKHGSVTQIPTIDWTIAANVITKLVAFNPSPGGAVNAQTASVTYWV